MTDRGREYEVAQECKAYRNEGGKDVVMNATISEYITYGRDIIV